MTIKKRLMLMSAVLGILIIVSIITGLYSNKQNDAVNEANHVRYLSFLIADEFRQVSADLTKKCRTYVATGDQQYWDEYFYIVNWSGGDARRPDYVDQALYRGEIKDQLSIMKELGFSKGEFDLMSEAVSYSQALIATETQAMESISQGKIVEGPMTANKEETVKAFAIRIVFDDAYHGELVKIGTPINKFFGELDKRTSTIVTSAQSRADLMSLMAILVQILVAITVVVNGLLMTRSITTPIYKIVELTRKIADGDLTVRSDIDSQDEIGELSKSFNKLSEKLGTMITKIVASSKQVTGASNEISTSSEQMAAGAEEQQAQLSEVATSIEEMSAMILETSNNAEQTQGNANEANLAAEKGAGTVNQTIAGIEGIATIVESASQQITTLKTRSQEIADVIQVIDDISDQTNLLALNANIEAARAGEAGRGFAVVADEVRKLAERTVGATADIEEKIKQIQTDVNDSVKAMEQITDQSKSGQSLAAEAGEALGDISGSIEQVNSAITQIASAAIEQSAGVEQISKNVESVSTVSKQSASSAQELAASSEQLKAEVTELERLIEQFKV